MPSKCYLITEATLCIGLLARNKQGHATLSNSRADKWSMLRLETKGLASWPDLLEVNKCWVCQLTHLVKYQTVNWSQLSKAYQSKPRREQECRMMVF